MPMQVRQNSPWTVMELQFLAELLVQGEDYETIGRELGREPGACRRKAERMGWTRAWLRRAIREWGRANVRRGMRVEIYQAKLRKGRMRNAG